MAKQIVYVVTDSGVDGREPQKTLYASFSEEERDAMLTTDASKAWRGKAEFIIDPEVMAVQALSKLDGVDRLVLGLSAWPCKTAEAKVVESHALRIASEKSQKRRAARV